MKKVLFSILFLSCTLLACAWLPGGGVRTETQPGLKGSEIQQCKMEYSDEGGAASVAAFCHCMWNKWPNSSTASSIDMWVLVSGTGGAAAYNECSEKHF